MGNELSTGTTASNLYNFFGFGLETPDPKLENYESGSYKSKTNPRAGYFVNKKTETIYYRGKPISKADIDTFQKLGFGWAKDCKYVYEKGKTTNYSPKKFELDGNKPKI